MLNAVEDGQKRFGRRLSMLLGNCIIIIIKINCCTSESRKNRKKFVVPKK